MKGSLQTLSSCSLKESIDGDAAVSGQQGSRGSRLCSRTAGSGGVCRTSLAVLLPAAGEPQICSQRGSTRWQHSPASMPLVWLTLKAVMLYSVLMSFYLFQLAVKSPGRCLGWNIFFLMDLRSSQDGGNDIYITHPK